MVVDFVKRSEPSDGLIGGVHRDIHNVDVDCLEQVGLVEFSCYKTLLEMWTHRCNQV